MTVGVPTFCGERLREARLARGLYKSTLGEMIGVTGTAVTRYEEGQDRPQQEKLRALADQLKFPVDFFLRPAWPENLDLVFWRSRAAESKHAREMTHQRMRWLCETFSFLDEEVEFPSLSIPHLGLPEDFRQFMPEDIEQAAVKLRAHWGLRERPIPDMLLALENAGIPTACLEIVSEKQDGFCFPSARLKRSFVGININGVSAARERYDAAHELGHLCLHRLVTPQQSRDPSLHKLIEQQAHRFAGAFLFPKNAFLSEVQAATLDWFSALKKQWGLSIGAMIFRSYDLGLIDEFEKTTLFQKMTRRGWRGTRREPFDDPNEMPLERPRMLRRGIENVVAGGIFGRETIQWYLGLPAGEIEQLAGLDKGFISGSAAVEHLASPKRGLPLKAVDLESGMVVEFRQRPKSTS
jgi:Zn-dependent peptidase ImmA (M78 family)